MAYCGGSQNHGDLNCKVGQVWDYKGYLILIIALDSIYLSPYDDVANRLSESVSQACADDSSTYEVWERPDMQRVRFNKLWHDSVELCTIVQESHAALPIGSYSGYVLNPIPSVKGIGIQEGSLGLASYAWGVLSWDTFSVISLEPLRRNGIKTEMTRCLL